MQRPYFMKLSKIHGENWPKSLVSNGHKNQAQPVLNKKPFLFLKAPSGGTLFLNLKSLAPYSRSAQICLLVKPFPLTQKTLSQL